MAKHISLGVSIVHMQPLLAAIGCVLYFTKEWLEN